MHLGLCCEKSMAPERQAKSWMLALNMPLTLRRRCSISCTLVLEMARVLHSTQ